MLTAGGVTGDSQGSNPYFFERLPVAVRDVHSSKSSAASNAIRQIPISTSDRWHERIEFISSFLSNEHLPGPARPGNESCYLNRYVAVGPAGGEFPVVNQRRFDHLRVEVIRSWV
jgi:hypothetical protein